MNWNDYEAAWKRQELPVGAAADTAKLKATIETKRRKLAATLSMRDLTEAAAGAVVLLGMAFAWWQQGRAGWPISLAMLLILGVTGVFIRERIRAHRLRLGATAPLLVKVEADLAELRHQRHLLQNYWKWYLAPGAVSCVIFSLTLTRNRPPWDISRDPLFLSVFWSFFCLALWFAWLLTRRALRREIDPRIEELEKLRCEIAAED